MYNVFTAQVHLLQFHANSQDIAALYQCSHCLITKQPNHEFNHNSIARKIEHLQNVNVAPADPAGPANRPGDDAAQA